MADSLGKKYENKVRDQWKKCFPNSFIYRLPDAMGGFAGAGGSNPCDFFGFTNGKLFLIEVKEHKGASIPFTAIRQYEKLLTYKNIKDVFPGILVWLSEKDMVFWVPITEMEKMVKDGKKSIGCKIINEKSYKILEIPSEKTRANQVYMDSDFSVLLNLEKED